MAFMHAVEIAYGDDRFGCGIVHLPMKLIQATDLVDIQVAADAAGIRLRSDLIYADAGHPLNQTFAEAIYSPNAKMWMHKDLAEIVLLAAGRANAEGFRFVLTDCLRTTDAQQRMAETKIVQANPHWTAPGPGMLLSPPGFGAHPRAMAVDILLEDREGNAIDMGTALDHFSTDPNDNPAARDYPFPPNILANRKLLEGLMTGAANDLGKVIVPLASEWWDFRFPADVYEQYAPLSDSDLPDHMKMCA